MNGTIIKIGPAGQESTYEGMRCKECKVIWFMPWEFVEAHRRSGELFFCPSGHQKRITLTTQAPPRGNDGRNMPVEPFDKRPPTPMLGPSGGRPVPGQQPVPSTAPPQPIETRATSQLQINPQFGQG